jgi:hypothetical protein
MAGIFNQNLRDDISAPSSSAYATTGTSTTNVLPDSGTTQSNITNIQVIPQGFGAYLDGILPPDIATAAGSFSVSMQQIKNISSIPIEKFAQVVNSLETTKGLNVNGSSVPTDTSLASQGLALIALGNGPYGTYTMSNFLGCMSGLPYLGINIRQLIQQLETPTLYDIYRNLYLAVTWEQAGDLIVTYNNDGFGNYTFVSVALPTNRGGGYGRENIAPVVTIAGATGALTIGTDPNNLSTYGKITGSTFSASGTTSSPTTTVTIPEPTTIHGSSGWSPGMNNAITYYIGLANTEIVNIKNSQPARAQQLITNWEKTGTILSIEQRAIATGMSLQVPLADPVEDREPTLAGYPTTQYSFVDSIPRYAKFTQPHMYSQTLEAISNLNTVGGRSIVAMLREARNQARLQEAGIPLDNNIENKLTNAQEAQLIANGILPNSVPAGDGTFVDTVPASLQTELGVPDPYGYYDPTTDNYYNTNPNYEGNGEAIDTGQAIEPGSFAGSRYRSLIPPELSSVYASDVLLPSTYSIQEAIDEVIRCNCDCWDNI